MKKILTLILLLAGFSLFGLNNDAFASSNVSNKESLIDNDTTFQKAVDLGLVTSENNGELNYLGNQNDLNVQLNSIMNF